jgi:Uncharacterised protein conserved in bacteria (DUF2336)
MAQAQDNEQAAAILGRRAQGLLALDETLAELADANCIITIAAVIAERIRLQPDIVAQALDAESDEPISVMCRAAGFSLNGFSALLRMRRRRHHGSRSAADALAFFSGLQRASAERILQQMVPRRADRRIR